MILQIFKYGLGLKKTKQPHFLAIFVSIHPSIQPYPSIQLPQATKWARFVTDMDLKDADAGSSWLKEFVKDTYFCSWWLQPTQLKHISQNGFIFPK